MNTIDHPMIDRCIKPPIYGRDRRGQPIDYSAKEKPAEKAP